MLTNKIEKSNFHLKTRCSKITKANIEIKITIWTDLQKHKITQIKIKNKN